MTSTHMTEELREETYQELRTVLNVSLFDIRRQRERLLIHHVRHRKQCRR